MKNLKTFDEFLNESIVVNKDYAKNEIERIKKEVEEQIKVAGKKGQTFVILNFEAPDYSSGSQVMDSLTKEGLVKIRERGFGSQRFGTSYQFNVSCDITKKSLIDKNAAKKATEIAIKYAISQAEMAASKGQSQVVINWELPNYSDGNAVQKALEEEGVYCNERGYSVSKNRDGSWTFNQTSTIRG